MSCVAEHPTFQRTLKLLDRTIGREKLLRVVQYWSRFFAFYLYRQGYSKKAVLFWKTLQQQVALSRKLFRVGKPLGHFKLAAAACGNQTIDPILRLTTIGRQIGYMGYMALDTVMWVHMAKVRPFTADRFGKIQRIAYRFWMAGLLFGLVNSARKYQTARAQEIALSQESEKDGDSLKKVKADKCAATKQFVWDVLDLSIPTSALKIVDLDDGIVGLCGLITSILGLKQVW
ncbi:peroxisomal membrane protein PMP27 [Trichomonascus vanleenenianus]|uniref:PEX11 family protein n=1 Tax=Trichomonascus vanleenenianus TaxID=2268995 RepID=UPI003ECB6F9F